MPLLFRDLHASPSAVLQPPAPRSPFLFLAPVLPHPAAGTGVCQLVVLDARDVEKGPVAVLQFKQASATGAAELALARAVAVSAQLYDTGVAHGGSAVLLLGTPASERCILSPPPLLCSPCPAACMAAGPVSTTDHKRP